MTWDDHDIFDGWGSYPDTLQNCPVFQGCYQAALRFYLLFQQHTSLQRIGETDLFGHRCASYERVRASVCYIPQGTWLYDGFKGSSAAACHPTEL